MIILIGFAFIAGFVTILSPCILPILPIVLSGGISNDKNRPLGIVIGFILSFTFFTLFLSSLVKLTGISPDLLRGLSVAIIFGFGLSLLIPRFQIFLEIIFSKLSNKVNRSKTRSGFFGGILLGLSLGLIWTPCVGPIIASVITLAASSTVTSTSVVITIAYSLGTAIPMLLITYGGRALLQKNLWLVKNTVNIQKIFGVLMMITAIGIFFNVDRSFQAYILEVFPQYGTNLTKIEDNKIVREELQLLKDSPPIMNVNQAPDFIPNGTWLNSDPLTMSELKGKVVLVDFWTYTCINCIRTLPYLTAWHDLYKDKGLVIIGIHTPEFEFEKKKENVENAMKQYGISYPVLMDNEYENWNAFNNRYWPAKYLIDSKGQIRYTHFGEGEYIQTEKMIQELLKEAGNQKLNPIQTEEKSEDLILRRTPEIYLGSDRTERRSDTIKGLSKDFYYLNGKWQISNEYAVSTVGSSLTLNFSGKEVNLVISPAQKGNKIRIYLNDKLLNTITLDTERLYNLVKLTEYTGSSMLKIEFLDDGIKCFAFTFG